MSHRQQGNYHGQGTEKYQDDLQSSPCDIRKKTKRTTYSTFSSLLRHLWTCVHNSTMTQACGGTGADPDLA